MSENSFLDLVLHQKEIIRGYGREALRYQRGFGIDPRTGDNGEGDAFRHCYGAARAATEFGPMVADLLGAEKEWRDITVKKASPAAVNMDLWNNIVGIRVAAIAGNSGDASSDKKNELAELCNSALRKGVLKGSADDSRPISNLTDEELARIEEPGEPGTEPNSVSDTEAGAKRIDDVDIRLHEFRERLEERPRSGGVERKDIPPDRRFDGTIA